MSQLGFSILLKDTSAGCMSVDRHTLALAGIDFKFRLRLQQVAFLITSTRLFLKGALIWLSSGIGHNRNLVGPTPVSVLAKGLLFAPSPRTRSPIHLAMGTNFSPQCYTDEAVHPHESWRDPEVLFSMPPICWCELFSSGSISRGHDGVTVVPREREESCWRQVFCLTS